ncbi:hypothetical protein GMES_1612 [Paraglaciecola mesophila KMM 241]|uniref:Uncharacterized protein n=1 Tax=Paraglaciecola mesophila KMM 241 TaxID=1128912 RepID=K6Z4H8_9ALTE|nr:hypothetical protein [Paraglaciecola mesophila]GAC23908.1 hypothetical protein GMES_1612 [Paraglaciecola mesophila KMM 241]
MARGKKEIVYLCGTFFHGESVSSVISQLDTSQFLQYSVSHIEGNTNIVATSDAPFFGYAWGLNLMGKQQYNRLR